MQQLEEHTDYRCSLIGVSNTRSICWWGFSSVVSYIWYLFKHKSQSSLKLHDFCIPRESYIC